MTENEISYLIRGAVFEVYNELGPGLLESIYEAALFRLLREENLKVLRQMPVPVIFRGEDLGQALKLDLLVEEKVIIELKSVEALAPVHHKQLMTYLKLTKIKLGLLINFNEVPIKIKRIVNGL
tara:strand:- start:26 stop:397 length:372 start_codon:yes stop_codon:yes gene_type:complete